MIGSICTSFRLDGTVEEIDLVEQAMTCFDAMCIGWMSKSDLIDAALPDPRGAGARMSGLREALRVHIGTRLGLTMVRMDDHAVIHGSGVLNLPAMAEILRLLATQALPLRITWATTFDPLKPGSAFGGWLVVHSHRTVHGDARDATRQEIRRVAGRKDPTDIQIRALAAYNEDDGEFLAATIEESDGSIGRHLLSEEIGDSMAGFIYLETGDAGSAEEAADMMRRAASQLEDVANALEQDG